MATILKCKSKLPSKLPWHSHRNYVEYKINPKSVSHGYNSMRCKAFQNLKTFLESKNINLDNVIVPSDTHYMLKIRYFIDDGQITISSKYIWEGEFPLYLK